MFKIFKKPTIKGRLVSGGDKAKVDLININKSQQFILLHMIIKQIAAGMKVDQRYVLNRLIDMDKEILKARKSEVKQAKYGKK